MKIKASSPNYVMYGELGSYLVEITSITLKFTSFGQELFVETIYR